MNRFVIQSQLPTTGEVVDIVVQADAIAVRIGGRIAVAHGRWMSDEEARQVHYALGQLLQEEGPT